MTIELIFEENTELMIKREGVTIRSLVDEQAGPTTSASDIMALVHEAVGGLELEPGEKRAIWRYAQRELPYLWSQRTSYSILGQLS